MTPEKMHGEPSPEKSNSKERLKSEIRKAFLAALSTEATETELDFFKRFMSHMDKHFGIDDFTGKQHNKFLNLHYQVEFVKEDLDEGHYETKEEAIESFFDDPTVKKTLGL